RGQRLRRAKQGKAGTGAGTELDRLMTARRPRERHDVAGDCVVDVGLARGRGIFHELRSADHWYELVQGLAGLESTHYGDLFGFCGIAHGEAHQEAVELG